MNPTWSRSQWIFSRYDNRNEHCAVLGFRSATWDEAAAAHSSGKWCMITGNLDVKKSALLHPAASAWFDYVAAMVGEPRNPFLILRTYMSDYCFLSSIFGRRLQFKAIQDKEWLHANQHRVCTRPKLISSHQIIWYIVVGWQCGCVGPNPKGLID